MNKQFKFSTPLTDLSGDPMHVGDLEITGEATCNHPADTDSYDFTISDVVLIKDEQRTPFYEILSTLYNGDIYRCNLVKYACEAHCIGLWGDEADVTTDNRQDLFEAMATILKPNNAA